ncbi:hypothetical protein JCM19232_2460 [Vibrio ishigakensis]|nr:hypothetical protein JCM19232_2460 [Vibrio ishigakensis]
MQKALYYILSAALICLALLAGNFLQVHLSLAIPGSVLGLIILFLGLV